MLFELFLRGIVCSDFVGLLVRVFVISAARVPDIAFVFFATTQFVSRVLFTVLVDDGSFRTRVVELVFFAIGLLARGFFSVPIEDGVFLLGIDEVVAFLIVRVALVFFGMVLMIII
jgi:hypothetical protein